MKKFVMSGLIVALIAAGVTMGCCGETEEPMPTEGIGELPGTYQYSMEWSDSDGATVSLDVWVKGEKSRVDISITAPGEETETIIFINDGEFEWIYNQDEDVATKYQSGVGMSLADAYTWWFTEYYYGTVSEGTILAEIQAACAIDPICSSAAIIGHETVGGQYCTKFAYTATDGATIIYWISSSGWLMKVEFTNATGYSVTMEFTDVDLNPSISDDIFDMDKVAPDAEIIDMTEWQGG